MFIQKIFCLEDEDRETINEWAETHECTCRNNDRPSRSCCGGEISVVFTPTTIGTAVSAHCICGQKLELDNL